MMVLYTLCSYEFATAMVLLTAFAFVCLYVRTALKSKPASFLVFMVLSMVVYAIAGNGYLLFAGDLRHLRIACQAAVANERDISGNCADFLHTLRTSWFLTRALSKLLVVFALSIKWPVQG